MRSASTSASTRRPMGSTAPTCTTRSPSSASLLRPDLVTEGVSETLACDTSSDPYLAGSLYRSESPDRRPVSVATPDRCRWHEGRAHHAPEPRGQRTGRLIESDTGGGRPMVVRWIAALVAFVAVVLIGVVTIGNFGDRDRHGQLLRHRGRGLVRPHRRHRARRRFRRLRRRSSTLQTGALDSISAPVRHAHHRAHADRDRGQHHPRRDRRQRARRSRSTSTASAPSWSPPSPDRSRAR